MRTVRQIPPATPSGFDFLFRTRPRALWQQTPPEPVLILQTMIFLYTSESWNFPNVGYYCPADGLQTLDAPPRYCTLHCLQMQVCTIISYNNADGRCILLPTPCTLALQRQDMDYVMFTGRNHEQCVKWVQFPGSDPMILGALESPGGYLACRMNINGAIFVLTLYFEIGGCYTTDGGSQYFVTGPFEIPLDRWHKSNIAISDVYSFFLFLLIFAWCWTILLI